MHCLLGGWGPRQAGCWSDFDLRTDNQAITWLKTNRHLNKMYVRWLDEIEDFHFDVTHLPGSRNPTDPLSRRGFTDGNGPAESTGAPDAESQQELFSRQGRDAPAAALDAGHAGRRSAQAMTPPAGARWLDEVEAELLSGRRRDPPVPSMLAAVRATWAATRREAAVTFASTLEGGANPPTPSPRSSMFIALAGSELSLGTGTTTAPPPPVPSDDLFLSPTFVQTLAEELAVDAVFGPIMRDAAAALGKLVDRLGTPVVEPARTPKGGTFLVRCGLLYRRGQGETDRLCIPAGGGLRPRLRAQVLRECHDGPLGADSGPDSGATSGAPRPGRWYAALPSGWDRTSTSPSTCARARRASAQRRSTAAHAGSFTPFRCHRGAAG